MATVVWTGFFSWRSTVKTSLMSAHDGAEMCGGACGVISTHPWLYFWPSPSQKCITFYYYSFNCSRDDLEAISRLFSFSLVEDKLTEHLAMWHRPAGPTWDVKSFEYSIVIPSLSNQPAQNKSVICDLNPTVWQQTMKPGSINPTSNTKQKGRFRSTHLNDQLLVSYLAQRRQVLQLKYKSSLKISTDRYASLVWMVLST